MRAKTIYKRFLCVLSLLLLVFIIHKYTCLFSKYNPAIFGNSELFLVNEGEDNSSLFVYSSMNFARANGHGFKLDRIHTVQLPPFVDRMDPAGPGEGGAAVQLKEADLSSDINKTHYKDGWIRYHFNAFVSERISIHRSLPDCRSNMCKKWVKQFNGTLPEFSVIIAFNNEAWTTLVRSVHSVINRTPDHLLKEIVLVDDNSDLAHLRRPLDTYFRLFQKVKIIHAPQRIGLIRARLLGFDSSVAPIVIFLDSHVECFPGWAESMLIRIAKNPQAVVFPIIESISDSHFGVQCSTRIDQYCTFLWKTLQYHWVPIPRRELDRRMDDTDSYRSPTMPGGLFAISREFFAKLGKYDPELGFWGGENIELSFKTWMCGGTLEMDPCSHVGHVFRLGGSIKVNASVIFRNAVRVAEVWMDDYKNYFYEMNNYRNINPGYVTDRLSLGQSLKCRSFGWYLKNVFPEKSFPHSMKYAGEIRSAAFTKCIDSNIQNHDKSDRPVLIGCSGYGRNQVWYMGVSGQIFQEDLHSIYICIVEGKVMHRTTECQPSRPHWGYRKDQSLYHVPTDQCLTANAVTDTVFMATCTNSTLQKWHFQERRTDLMFPNYT